MSREEMDEILVEDDSGGDDSGGDDSGGDDN